MIKPLIRKGEHTVVNVQWDAKKLKGEHSIYILVDPQNKLQSVPVPPVVKRVNLSPTIPNTEKAFVNIKKPYGKDEYTLFYANFDHSSTADFAIGSPYQLLGYPKFIKGRYGNALVAKEKQQFLEYKIHNERFWGSKQKTSFYDPDGNLREGGVNVNPEEGTIEMFFNVDDFNTKANYVLYIGYDPPYRWGGRQLKFDNKKKLLIFHDRNRAEKKDTIIEIPYEGLISTNTWYHIAGTWNSNEIRLYLNGKLIASKKKNYSSIAKGLFYIGASRKARYKFNGRIDEFRISKVARTKFTIGDIP